MLITKKRFNKIKKYKIQSRKKHKKYKKGGRKNNRSFRKKRYLDLKNKTLKKHKRKIQRAGSVQGHDLPDITKACVKDGNLISLLFKTDITEKQKNEPNKIEQIK